MVGLYLMQVNKAMSYSSPTSKIKEGIKGAFNSIKSGVSRKPPDNKTEQQRQESFKKSFDDLVKSSGLDHSNRDGQ